MTALVVEDDYELVIDTEDRGIKAYDQTAILTVRWPIGLDTPIGEALQEGTRRLTLWLMRSGWRQASPIDWSLGRDYGDITFIATVPVARAVVQL